MNDFIISDWLYYILMVIYIITIMGTIIVIISENRNPLKSIAWVIVLLFFPVGGLIFYIFLGRNFRKHRMISKKSFQKINQYSFSHLTDINDCNLPSSSEREAVLLTRINDSNLYSGNNVDIYTNGYQFFDALFSAIDDAEKFIHLQFYIFQNDILGSKLKELLMKKRREGVEIRVMFDDVGCWSVPKKFFKEMTDIGIEVNSFYEVRFPAFANKINYRNHRKIAVIDGHYGFIGGMNIADRYLDGLKWGTWRDTHLRIQGPAVLALQRSFSIDWYFSDKELLWDAKYFPNQPKVGSITMQIATGGPIGEWREMMLAVFRAVSNAKKYVYIQTPYFLPTDALMIALQSAALSGVDVRIMMPERADSHLVHVGSCSYIRSMLISDVKVYFYQPGFLHSKMIIVDDELCSVGSANMDFRSFEHNFEANAFIYDENMTKQMKKIFLNDQQNCRRINLREWRNRPAARKALESVLRLFSPML